MIDDLLRERLTQLRLTLDQPSKAEWFASLLVNLCDGLSREYESLIKNGDVRSANVLAWACRNLLEINIHIQYVLGSKTQASDYCNDTLIDGLQIFESLHNWSIVLNKKLQEGLGEMGLQPELPPAASPDPLLQTIVNFKGQITKRGITRTSYLSTKQMARAIGMSDEFEHVNKITSKLVHPTAYSVLISPYNDQNADMMMLRSIIRNTGIRYVLEAIDLMEKHLKGHGLEPLLNGVVPTERPRRQASRKGSGGSRQADRRRVRARRRS